MNKNLIRSPAGAVVLVGLCAAITECGKLALASIPNVEVVTLFTALFSYCFGIVGLLSAVIFVIIEALIWGVNLWIISYAIYWPLLAIVFIHLGKFRIKNRIVLTSIALFMTLLFGVIDSFVEIGLFQGYFDNFLSRFFIYYSRGVAFYLAQLITNLVLFPILFPYLSRRLMPIKRKFLR